MGVTRADLGFSGLNHHLVPTLPCPAGLCPMTPLATRQKEGSSICTFCSELKNVRADVLHDTLEVKDEKVRQGPRIGWRRPALVPRKLSVL